MKIGDRVRLLGLHVKMNRRFRGLWRGTVIALRPSGCQVVRWDHGGRGSYHDSFLVLEEPFPYRSHRNMAEVIADEQRPESA